MKQRIYPFYLCHDHKSLSLGCAATRPRPTALKGPKYGNAELEATDHYHPRVTVDAPGGPL